MLKSKEKRRGNPAADIDPQYLSVPPAVLEALLEIGLLSPPILELRGKEKVFPQDFPSTVRRQRLGAVPDVEHVHHDLGHEPVFPESFESSIPRLAWRVGDPIGDVP